MSKTVMIFLDTPSVTWGDGTHLNHNDATFRANIKADTAINGSGYLVNGVPSQLTYSNATFTTPKPVKLVLSAGSTTAVDLATAYSNAGQPLMSSYTSRPTLNGTTIIAGGYTVGTAIMFGVLNDTARKADGSPATNNSEAVYFEIVWQVGKIDFSFDFVGMEGFIKTYPTQSGNSTHGVVGLGRLDFNRTTFQPLGGDYIASVNGSGGFKPFLYTKNNNGGNDIANSTLQAGNNKIFRYEIGKAEKAIVNITDSYIFKLAHSIDFSNIYCAPFIYVSGGDSGANMPLEIENAKIVITNPA